MIVIVAICFYLSENFSQKIHFFLQDKLMSIVGKKRVKPEVVLLLPRSHIVFQPEVSYCFHKYLFPPTCYNPGVKFNRHSISCFMIYFIIVIGSRGKLAESGELQVIMKSMIIARFFGGKRSLIFT